LCLFSTENDPEHFPRGLYDHGKYPFVTVNFMHAENSLYGMGLVDVGADAQIQIDLINDAVVKNTLMAVNPRYFKTKNTAVREEDLADWGKTFVEVSSLDERALKVIETQGLSGNYLSFLASKIEELKYVTANTDAANGAAPGGVTAASAIAALQEASGKHARLINRAFYGAYREVVWHVVELIRQFYRPMRWFRLLPDVAGRDRFLAYSNEALRPQTQSDGSLRIPEFDIEISAEKANPYRRMEANELALSFYKMGLFSPASADMALACVDMMDFPQKDSVLAKIRQNQTLSDTVSALARLSLAMAQKSGDAEAVQAIGQILASVGRSVSAESDVDPARAARADDITGESRRVEIARAKARAATEVDG
ncbi:MAG: hypothetical protein IJX13_04970, partial [Clostridia bacterium]|nr:hypothetical protein [Clostridia bacterium]